MFTKILQNQDIKAFCAQHFEDPVYIYNLFETLYIYIYNLFIFLPGCITIEVFVQDPSGREDKIESFRVGVVFNALDVAPPEDASLPSIKYILEDFGIESPNNLSRGINQRIATEAGVPQLFPLMPQAGGLKRPFYGGGEGGGKRQRLDQLSANPKIPSWMPSAAIDQLLPPLESTPSMYTLNTSGFDQAANSLGYVDMRGGSLGGGGFNVWGSSGSIPQGDVDRGHSLLPIGYDRDNSLGFGRGGSLGGREISFTHVFDELPRDDTIKKEPDSL